MTASTTTLPEIATIRDWWASGGPRGGYSADRMFTIAGSAHDQTTPDGVDNPYWEIIRHLPSIDDRWDGITPYSHPTGLDLGRHELVTRYSWSIPSPGDITWMRDQLDGRSLVEVGAGSGYWAWQAQQAGIDVVAYEPNEPANNKFVDGREYVTLRRDDHAAAGRHPDRALMLCWPSYSTSWAAEALAAYKGDTLIYMGESGGGCCADDDFFEAVGKEWTGIGSSPHHITWWGIHDRMTAYRR